MLALHRHLDLRVGRADLALEPFEEGGQVTILEVERRALRKLGLQVARRRRGRGELLQPREQRRGERVVDVGLAQPAAQGVLVRGRAERAQRRQLVIRAAHEGLCHNGLDGVKRAHPPLSRPALDRRRGSGGVGVKVPRLL